MSDQSIEQEELKEKCDHDRCHCVPEQHEPVLDGKSVYCSPGCRDGSGCRHPDCNCAAQD